MSVTETQPTAQEAPTRISAGGVKKTRNVGLKVVTANALLSGVVVYRQADGTWTEELGDAAIVEGDDAMAALDTALAAEAEIVGPYLMDVAIDADRPVPSGRATLRETIRDIGPTIHPQFARRTAGGH